MAPIKFEENIKDKLEKRTLSPSSEGWSKLSDRLDADEKKSKSPIFWWLGIAAGIVLMIAVSTQLFNSSSSENTIPKMVNDNHKVEQIEDKAPKLNDAESIELVSEGELDKVENEDSTHLSVPQSIKNPKDEIAIKPTKKIQVAENAVEDDKKIEQYKFEKLHTNLKDVTNEAIMQEAIVKAMNDLKSEYSEVTDREIDSLLKIASKELFKEKIQKETSKTVNANALLMSVEEEMGQSFRTKVFEALKDSFETVKTAVAERNN